MKNQKNLQKIVEGKPWFNFIYKVSDNDSKLRDNYIPSGLIIPHPINYNMSFRQFETASQKLKNSLDFLEVENYKLESPTYDKDSVNRINTFRGIYGGSLTNSLPDAIEDMGFGEIYLRIYVCRNINGIINVKSSSKNIFANEISLYGFTKNNILKTINELGLPI